MILLRVSETAKDAFDRLYEYTGNLRAVMPLEEVPKREVPEHIPRPDYANNGASPDPFRVFRNDTSACQPEVHSAVQVMLTCPFLASQFKAGRLRRRLRC